ncbi:hypothetical protein [Plantactinospora sp. KLBMP9567]|uniref:hypothetical protein n=1 Tax=Plantactinospora sp. KLBMP9567 TaxID=3085900 RepID=UPI002980DFCB|nr:hypothetical protein [Plantactinospora sp. KLBMP9567]MDW5327001.1 hypothetical protein [Plantactinospora sp. KLBMP9567]
MTSNQGQPQASHTGDSAAPTGFSLDGAACHWTFFNLDRAALTHRVRRTARGG